MKRAEDAEIRVIESKVCFSCTMVKYYIVTSVKLQEDHSPNAAQANIYISFAFYSYKAMQMPIGKIVNGKKVGV